MTIFNKSIFIGTALAGLFVMEGSQAAVHSVTSKVVDTIKNAPDAKAAEDLLCKQGGVLRGSGLFAGNNCKDLEIALIFEVGCKDYPQARGSKCDQNAMKIVGALEAAPNDLKKAAQVKGSTAEAILCAAPRAKLPARLRQISDEVCRPFQMLIPGQAKMIDDLRRDESKLEKLEKPLERAPKEILERSVRNVKQDLKDIKQKILSFLEVTKSAETLSKNDEFQAQALLLQSGPFLQKLETMGIRVNPETGVVEILNDQTKKWDTMR